MTIAVTGFSHHTSPLALRDRMSLGQDEIVDTLTRLHRHLGKDSGVAILATCNRFEIYVCAPGTPNSLHQQIVSLLETLHQMEKSEFSRFLYHYADGEAVRHIFRVAASLDSMVVGENEIMGQIQHAYDAANSMGTLNRVLSMLLQRALKCGKRVRTETRISAGKVSVASVAVDLAASILKDLTDKTAMIVGSGKISEQALKNLVERGIKRVLVLNRTVGRAQALAQSYRGEALILDALPCHLHRADIVISSTGAPEFILHASDFERAVERRGHAPMFLIDLAVPRDIEREASKVNNVYCYDLDDLQRGAACNLHKRESEIEACEVIIKQEAKSFRDWHRRLHVEPLIVEMTKHYHEVREQELRRTLKRLNGVPPEVRAEVENLSQRIVNVLLRQPIACVKSDLDGEGRDKLMQLAQRMFISQELGQS